MERIRQLQEQEKDILRTLEEIRELIQQEYERYVAKTFKVKPGTIVRNCANQLYSVHRAYYSEWCWDSVPWLHAYKQHADGSFGKRIHLLYRWEVVE